MPDLITHTAVAYPLAKLLKQRVSVLIFLIGTILPDLMSRTFLVLWPHHYQLSWAAQVIHTPIGFTLGAYAASLFFQTRQRLLIFITLLLGAASHQFLDLLQRHYYSGYYLLFPFSYVRVELPLFWGEEILGTLYEYLKRFAFIPG